MESRLGHKGDDLAEGHIPYTVQDVCMRAIRMQLNIFHVEIEEGIPSVHLRFLVRLTLSSCTGFLDEAAHAHEPLVGPGEIRSTCTALGRYLGG
jgi:hypothetical protein